jgi:hypothetical protein
MFQAIQYFADKFPVKGSSYSIRWRGNLANRKSFPVKLCDLCGEQKPFTTGNTEGHREDRIKVRGE